jgi:hypothetical protein
MSKTYREIMNDTIIPALVEALHQTHDALAADKANGVNEIEVAKDLGAAVPAALATIAVGFSYLLAGQPAAAKIGANYCLQSAAAYIDACAEVVADASRKSQVIKDAPIVSQGVH